MTMSLVQRQVVSEHRVTHLPSRHFLGARSLNADLNCEDASARIVVWRGFRQIRRVKRIEAAGGTLTRALRGCATIRFHVSSSAV